MLAGQDGREIVGVGFQQLLEAKHHARAPQRRQRGPGRERVTGRLYGRVDLGRTGQRHLFLDLAGG